MVHRSRMCAAAFCWLLGVSGLWAEPNWKVGGKPLQIHGFASQGFAVSDHNNYLTMRTTSGSFAFTDAGLNVAMPLTDKFRVGAQLYVRNVGEFGQGRPQVDWAVADYRFADWLGIRGGKVKTVVSLYNDTQDMVFLHPWALMPGSLYSVDARGDTIAHLGADLYGTIPAGDAGSLAYTVYGGKRPSDMQGGFVYGLETSSLVTTPSGPVYVVAIGKQIDSYSGPTYGADLRWSAPLPGLLLGGSYMKLDTTIRGSYLSNGRPYENHTLRNDLIAAYGQYTWRQLEFTGEYRKEVKNTLYNSSNGAIAPPSLRNSRGGYGAVVYRPVRWFECGTYHSRFVLNWDQYHGDPRNHVFDQAFTARFNWKHEVHLKVEGHLIDGAMINSGLNRGFYAASNPNGLEPEMKLLVLRLGWNF
ncbi:MAG: hypothetical protein J0L64_17650 [Acidobacteria bacterium]|nr:hypothetical protein [Acidobacteriota bacterium]